MRTNLVTQDRERLTNTALQKNQIHAFTSINDMSRNKDPKVDRNFTKEHP